jgi:hypothetical protein
MDIWAEIRQNFFLNLLFLPQVQGEQWSSGSRTTIVGQRQYSEHLFEAAFESTGIRETKLAQFRQLNLESEQRDVSLLLARSGGYQKFFR